MFIDNDYEDQNADNEIVGSLPTTSANPPSNRCSKLLKGCSEDQAAMDEEEKEATGEEHLTSHLLKCSEHAKGEGWDGKGKKCGS